MSEYVLEMKNISKEFPGVKALSNVSFKVKSGEIHALVGENGAGKSTLMKVLDGVYKADQGEILIDGKKVEINNPNDAKGNGISLIFQEFNLISTLSVSENIFLGHLGKGNWLDWKKIHSKTQELLDRLGFPMKPDTLIDELSVAEKQMTEITKALAIDAKIIVMDEPSATLTEKEIEMMFKIIRDLKAQGITIIYISHRMEEIFEICDTITVLRDGQIIDTVKTIDTTSNSIIEKMVGRPLDMEFPRKNCQSGDVVLEAKDIFTKNILNNISFDLRKGEILGIAGLVGAGRTELVRAIYGADKRDSGDIFIKGKKVKILSVKDSIKNSMGLVPEDRKEQGLALDFSVMHNITISDLNKICTSGLINTRKEKKAAVEFVKKLGIKTPTIHQKLIYLSGGNQQKVVFAKWHYYDADILILDEPTRGIDVGAKYEIYLLMNQMAEAGKSIIMISSELSEVIGMSDRILVMHDGYMKALLDREQDDISSTNIMKIAIS
jgi:ribose transport system ATP-binding protein